MNNADNKKHTNTITTLKADAGYKKYHCGFFCQRKTIMDEVFDPSVKRNESQPTEGRKSPPLTPQSQ